jgi:CHAT domain-containing protein/Tfp pilus assembly protein PilF
MKTILSILFFCFFLRLQAQTTEMQNSRIPDPLEDSVKKYLSIGRLAQALNFATQWQEKSKLNPGSDSLQFAAALNLFGETLTNTKKLKEAEFYLQKGLDLRRKALGNEHEDVAGSLKNLGGLFFYMQDFQKSELYYQKALEITQKVKGPEHPQVAECLYNLAYVLQYKGDYSRSESLYMKCINLRKKILGPQHPDLIIIYRTLGDLYDNKGEYAKAENNYLQALDIAKNAWGPEHPRLIGLLHRLGYLYSNFGDKAKAERIYLQAIETGKKTGTYESFSIRNTLSSLGNLYLDRNEYSKAEPLLIQALEFDKKNLGAEHPDIADPLCDLGDLYWYKGDFDKAEKCYIHAVEIATKTLGPEPPWFITILSRLGEFYTEKGEFEKAEALLLQALSGGQKNLGPEHPDLIQTMITLGELYSRSGNFTKAEPYYLKALEIGKKMLGPEHPEISFSLLELGIFYYSHGKIREAAKIGKDAASINQKLIERYFPVMSEQGREAYLKQLPFDIFQSFLATEGKDFPELRCELFNLQLYLKGIILNSSARWKQRIKTSGDLKLIRRFDEWENLQNEISRLFSSVNLSDRAGIGRLFEKAEKLEKELSRRSENFSSIDDRKTKTWQEVQEALQSREASIEIVRFKKIGKENLQNKNSKTGLPNYGLKLSDTIQYAALILTKNSRQPELVILPNGNDLEGKWYKYYRNSVQLQEKDAESYRQFWEPLNNKLKGIKKIWFSADGVYHKLNLGILQNPASGIYLMDEYEIALLGSSKDLLKKYRDESENRLACLLGNPEFHPGQEAVAGKSRSGPELSYFFKPDPGLEIAALPGTQTEVDSVASILNGKGWEVMEYSGADASEEKVKDIYKPRVMLLSTHGFFRPDTTSSSNPLLQSGLLLSGAAKTLREGRGDKGEDGILTAYEAMNLNLDNTELVVLSACETGLGEIKNGEGVYGLQRAFHVAGARNLIMSLWKVDDEVTKDLMVSFFRNWSEIEARSGLPSARSNSDNLRRAFYKAQMEIREKFPEPHYWGGFVLLGR